MFHHFFNSFVYSNHAAILSGLRSRTSYHVILESFGDGVNDISELNFVTSEGFGDSDSTIDVRGYSDMKTLQNELREVVHTPTVSFTTAHTMTVTSTNETHELDMIKPNTQNISNLAHNFNTLIEPNSPEEPGKFVTSDLFTMTIIECATL